MGRRLKTYGITADMGTVATTGATSQTIIVPKSGVLKGAYFSCVEALTADDTNYITFSALNKGQAGSGSTALLAATDPNTTKATGGTGLAAHTPRALTPHATAANVAVTEGDRIICTATVTGTLGGTKTLSRMTLIIDANGQ